MLQWFRKQATDANATPANGDLHVALTRKLIDFLTGQISQPKKAPAVLALIDRFRKFPPTYQEKELPGLYLKIENYLVREDTAQKFSRAQLRKTVRYRYEPLMEMQNFSLVFESEATQEFLLSQFFFKSLVLRANGMSEAIDEAFLSHLTEWVYRIPNVAEIDPPLNLPRNTPRDLADWLPMLNILSQRFFEYLTGAIGEQQAAALFEKSYKDLAEVYLLLNTFSAVVNLMPEHLIDEAKTNLLSKEQMQRVFLGKIRNLRQINSQVDINSQRLYEAQEELSIAQSTAMESVQLFHGVLDTIKEGVITADVEGTIISANMAIKNIFGYTEEELVGKNIQILMPEKYRMQHQHGMERYLKTRESRALNQKLTMEGLRKDSSAFPLEIYLSETVVSEQIFFTAAMRDISDYVRQENFQKKTAEDLRQADQRYRYLLENISDIVFTLSLDGNFLTLSPAFETITGFERVDWTDKPFTQMVHPEDAMEALKAFQKALQGESTDHLELRLQTSSGSSQVAEFHIAPHTQQNKMVGVMGIARSAPAEDSAIELLRASEDRFHNMIEYSPDTIGIHSNGKIVFINKAGIELFGAHSSNEVLHQPVTRFLNSGYLERAEDTVSHIMTTGNTAPLTDEILKRLDGTEVGIEASVIPVMYQNTQSIQFVFREKRVPETPAESSPGGAMSGDNDDRAEFQNLFNIAPDAIFVQELDGTILDVNPAAAAMQGLDRASLIGKSFLQILPDEIQDEASQNIRKLLRGSIESFDTAIMRIDRRQVPIEVRGRQIFYMDNPAVLLTAKDISQRHKEDQEKQDLLQRTLQADDRIRKAEEEARTARERYQEMELEVLQLRQVQDQHLAAKQTLELQHQQAERQIREAEEEQQIAVARVKDMEGRLERMQNEEKRLTEEKQGLLLRIQQSEREIKKVEGQLVLAEDLNRTLEEKFKNAETAAGRQQDERKLLLARLQQTEQQHQQLEDKLRMAEAEIALLAENRKAQDEKLKVAEEENQAIRIKLRKLGELLVNENSQQ